MKILLILSALVLLVVLLTSFAFRSKRKIETILNYGPFTVKAETVSGQTFNANYGIVKQSTIRYSVWHKDKIVEYPNELQGNTGYSHLWRVYVLEGAPKPTLIAGSQSLFMINEENGEAVVKTLHTQDSDFAGFQFLDEQDGQPGVPIPVYMDSDLKRVDTLKGGDYLLINKQLLLHIPDLKMTTLQNQKRVVDDYYFMSAGGVVAVSPDKKNLVFMGGKTVEGPAYIYGMIVYDDYATKSEYLVPYDRTLTRSIELNYDNREWFKTYFEWVMDKDNHYRLQVRQYDVLPFWQGRYADKNVVYQLTPVNNEMQQVFADFILQQLGLTKEAIHPGGQYSSNMMIIHYKNHKFSLWLRPEDKIVVLMPEESFGPLAEEQIKIIHELGDAFNEQLAKGEYQSNFTGF
ncbi:hypothetical protein [Chryseolinea lacunae]|uniref:Uncharacterized protein n=1 Tax=Chryseolinea lacunae TaxID=2801331 RepID=A0ABS1KM36_9BACT|nr:hypothetical protein [Chryseolinea lacunae]MBL0740393.1 hypothetical protein [Chryseolinea lacunae]